MIIVTGGTGFIGSNLIQYLNLQDEEDICIVDNVLPEKTVNLLGLKFSKFFTIENFLRDFDDWSNVEGIFHEGAISSTTETNQNKINRYNTNFSLDLLKKAVEYNIPFSYASSASVYGKGPDFTESSVLKPQSLYAESKALLDHEVTRLLATNTKCKIQGFRYFNVYGPCENHKGSQSSPVTKFTNQALDDGVIKVFENSDQFKRDFICVHDVVKIKYNMLSKDVSGIFNLGTGVAVSFRHVADIIANQFSATVEEIPFPDELKNQYQSYTCADMTKLKNVLGEYRFISVDEYVRLL